MSAQVFAARQPRGVGVGLRSQYHRQFEDERPSVAWLEAVTENYLGIDGKGGRALESLLRIREHYPVVLHGVSLSIGSIDPLASNYLRNLRDLDRIVEAAWVSDHLCWTSIDGENLHDLLPLPYTEEVLQHVASRVQYVQEFLQRTLVLENVSSYLSFTHSEMPEWEFVRAIHERTGCKILLDINNVYVSSVNHGFDAEEYLRAIPREAVQQFHLAGYSECETHLVDTHDNPVWPPVWELFKFALEIFGPRPTLIEWDDNLPSLDELLHEVAKAETILETHAQSFPRKCSALAEVGHHAP